MSYSAENRRKRLAAGLCGHCGKRPLIDGKSTECEVCKKDRVKRCTKSNDKHREAMNIRYARKRLERFEKGLCVRCGKNKLTPGRKTCQFCYDTQKKRTQCLKDQVYQAYGGYTCNCCGETIPQFLTLDHINGDGNRHRKLVKQNGQGFYKWLIRNNFPPILQVLCYNCNSGRQFNGGICPHKINQRKVKGSI